MTQRCSDGDAPPEDLEKGLPSPSSGCSTTSSGTPLVNGSHAFQRMWTWPKTWGNSIFQSKSKDGEAEKPKYKYNVRKLEDYALGYPKLAAYLDSDDQFSVYWRFGYLHSRLLLHKQDELRGLEDRLQILDNLDLNGDEDSTLLEQAQKLVAMNKPPNRDFESVRNFIEDKRPLLEEDAAFISEREDLITLRPGRETSFVDAFVERILQTCHCKPIQNIFASAETRAKTTDENIHYFTRSRINLCVTLIITCIILILLVIPIWLLYHATVTLDTNKSNTVCIGVLLVSTLVFSAVLSLFTKARRHEILAASAGYCAVLVVFVGNIGTAGIRSTLP